MGKLAAVRASCSGRSAIAGEIIRASGSWRVHRLNPNTHVFDFQVILYPILRPFPTQAGRFNPAEGGDLGGDKAGVNPDNAVLQRLADAKNAAQIAGVEIGREAELGVVGLSDNICLIFKAE